ncbi:MAG: HEAT repeat domain-containing protein [Candidatus Binatia bacterium]
MGKAGVGRLLGILASAAALLGGPVSAAAERPAGPKPLRVLAHQSTLVVVGTVEAADAFDQGRLRRDRVRIAHVLRGASETSLIDVVEIRGSLEGPPLLAVGDRVILLLQPAPVYSYLAQQLPPGTRWVIVGGRDGIVGVASDGAARTAEDLVGRALALDPDDSAESAAARRRLAFALLGARTSRLAADGVAELGRCGELGTLAADEQIILAAVLPDTAVPATVRAELVELLARGQVVTALPLLSRVRCEEPEVLGAVLAARARLGAPPTTDEFAVLLRDQRPAMRAAAVRGLAWVAGPASVAELARRATADEPMVRRAAVTAITEVRRADALPILRQTFEDADREVQQGSARALRVIAGPPADDILVDVALHGRSGDTRRYAAMLLLMAHGREDPVVKRLIAGHPSAEVQDVLAHGLETTHMHQH